MVAGIPWLKSVLSFFMHAVLICLFSEIFELCDILKGFITCLYFVFSSCIFLMKHGLIFGFSAFIRRSISFLVINKACLFFCSMSIFTQYINIISVVGKLMCPV
jgi:hypothetical protein